MSSNERNKKSLIVPPPPGSLTADTKPGSAKGFLATSVIVARRLFDHPTVVEDAIEVEPQSTGTDSRKLACKCTGCEFLSKAEDYSLGAVFWTLFLLVVTLAFVVGSDNL